MASIFQRRTPPAARCVEPFTLVVAVNTSGHIHGRAPLDAMGSRWSKPYYQSLAGERCLVPFTKQLACCPYTRYGHRPAEPNSPLGTTIANVARQARPAHLRQPTGHLTWQGLSSVIGPAPFLNGLNSEIRCAGSTEPSLRRRPSAVVVSRPPKGNHRHGFDYGVLEGRASIWWLDRLVAQSSPLRGIAADPQMPFPPRGRTSRLDLGARRSSGCVACGS